MRSFNLNNRFYASLPRVFSLVAAFLLAVVLSGCATGPKSNPADPLEPFNRSMTRFNDGLDTVVLKPVANAYKAVVPELVRKGVSNFFGNLGDLWSGVNNLLQGKPGDAATQVGRVLVNTTVGLGGLLDVAADAGLERKREDFGQTLGSWGVPSGPYLVLPLLGPSTLRDTAARPVDSIGNPVGKISDVPVRNSLTGLDIIDTRVKLLGVTGMMADALDPYSMTRNAYLAKRRYDVYDGNPPELPKTKSADEEDDEPEGKAVQGKSAPPTNPAVPPAQ